MKIQHLGTENCSPKDNRRTYIPTSSAAPVFYMPTVKIAADSPQTPRRLSTDSGHKTSTSPKTRCRILHIEETVTDDDSQTLPPSSTPFAPENSVMTTTPTASATLTPAPTPADSAVPIISDQKKSTVPPVCIADLKDLAHSGVNRYVDQLLAALTDGLNDASVLRIKQDIETAIGYFMASAVNTEQKDSVESFLRRRKYTRERSAPPAALADPIISGQKTARAPKIRILQNKETVTKDDDQTLSPSSTLFGLSRTSPVRIADLKDLAQSGAHRYVDQLVAALTDGLNDASVLRIKQDVETAVVDFMASAVDAERKDLVDRFLRRRRRRPQQPLTKQLQSCAPRRDCLLGEDDVVTI